MATVFNISREGQDADTTNRNNLVVTSLDKELKITKTESGTITITNGSATVTKAHGLGYRPAFLAFFEYPDDPSRYWVARTLMGNLGLSDYDSDARVDKTNIYLVGDRGDSLEAGNKDINYVYFLFDQPALMGASGNDQPIGFEKSNQGLIVSQPGLDADKTKLYEQQYNSSTDYLKYHLTVSGKIAYDNSVNGGDTAVITHNLGYIPVFMMYGASTQDLLYTAAPQGRSPLPFIASAGADKTNITVNIAWAGGGAGANTFLWRVVIFKNRMVI